MDVNQKASSRNPRSRGIIGRSRLTQAARSVTRSQELNLLLRAGSASFESRTFPVRSAFEKRSTEFAAHVRAAPIQSGNQTGVPWSVFVPPMNTNRRFATRAATREHRTTRDDHLRTDSG